jgi:hypothetical protein
MLERTKAPMNHVRVEVDATVIPRMNAGRRIGLLVLCATKRLGNGNVVGCVSTGACECNLLAIERPHMRY